METLKDLVLPTYTVIDTKDNLLVVMKEEGDERARIVYAEGNTGHFPRTYNEALNKQPLYFKDPEKHATLLDLYNLRYAVFPDTLRIRIKNLSYEQLFYCCLYFREMGYCVSETGVDLLEAQRCSDATTAGTPRREKIRSL
jgi:hypothetical protein